MPAVSVIMGIYNCADTLPQSVASVQNQTFSDWEMILCDDGSTDGTYATAQALAAKDERIRLLRNEKNRGLPYTLNRCAAEALSPVLARMDGDDVCSPDRFEKEYRLMQSGEYAVVSCGMSFFDDGGVYGEKRYLPFPQKADFAGNSPFCHAGALMRKDAFDAVGGYCEEKDRIRVEDFDLWFRMYKAGFTGANVQEILYSMRDDRNAAARKKFRYRINEYRLKKQIAKDFSFGAAGYIRALRPLILGLCPPFVYRALHKAKLGGAK